MLSLLLIFLFQIFFYLVDLYPVYLVAKGVFPLLSAGVAYVLLLNFMVRRRCYPYTMLLTSGLIYLVVQSAMASHVHFGQPILIGIAAQIKLLPILFFFLTLFVLRRWRVNAHELERSIVLLGLLTFVAAYALDALVDPRPLAERDVSVLVKYDEARGYRFVLPLIVGEIAIFVLFRRYLTTGRWRYLALVFTSLAYIAYVAEQRLELFGVVLVLFWVAVTTGRRLRRAFFVLALPIICIAGARAIPYFSPTELSAAFAVRWQTAGAILDFLGGDLARWMFGAGYLARLGDRTFQSVYGSNFWPSDVGWLGIIFELGIVGALIIAGLYVTLLREAGLRKANRPLVVLATRDFVFKALVISLLVPSIPIYTGVFATLLAFIVYFRRVPEHTRFTVVDPWLGESDASRQRYA